MSIGIGKNMAARIVDITALAVFGVFALMYSVETAYFAEITIPSPLAGVPLFVGEGLMLFCAVLYCLKRMLRGARPGKWDAALLVYLLFVAWKAIHGYMEWGALSLRNTALFLYPVFAVFFYEFFDARYLVAKPTRYLITLAVGVLFTLRVPDPYFAYTYLLVFLMFVISLMRDDRRNAFLGLFLVVFPYRALYAVHRGVFFAEICSMLFIFIWLAFIRQKKNTAVTRWMLAGIPLLFLAGAAVFVDPNAIKSIVNLDELLEHHRKYMVVAQERKDETDNTSKNTMLLYKKNTAEDRYRMPQEKYNDPGYQRSLEGAYKNILWRLYLWHYMAGEYAEGMPVFGMDLGRPIEPGIFMSLKWSVGDRWLEPHNSYLHMIYRTGLAGFAMVGVILVFFARLARRSVSCRGPKGVLLAACVLYWLVVANFEVILELPYFAIPLWGFFGMAVKYCDVQKEKRDTA
ncbi:MAG: hypothetical protein PHQ61_07750 [Candidatus Omnitrophica bacterium]|nr:hypothetical protein [Candidatus Omnitrophota bacterium]